MDFLKAVRGSEQKPYSAEESSFDFAEMASAPPILSTSHKKGDFEIEAPDAIFPEELRILGEVVPFYAEKGRLAQLQTNGNLCREVDVYQLYSMLESLKILRRGETSYFDPKRGTWTHFEGSSSLPECLFQKNFQILTASLLQTDDHLGQGVWQSSGSHLRGTATNIVPLYPLGGHYRPGLPFEEVAQSYFYVSDQEKETHLNPLSLQECIGKGLVPEEPGLVGRMTYFFPMKSGNALTSLAKDLIAGRCMLSLSHPLEEDPIVYVSTHYERKDPLSGVCLLYFKKQTERT